MTWQVLNQLKKIRDSFDQVLNQSQGTFESITIPSSVIDLKEGWCRGTTNLTQVRMSPSNPRYRFLDDIMIIWKTSNESDNYENLTFCVWNIKKITIPNFIKHISIPDNVEVIEKVLFLVVNDFDKLKFQKNQNFKRLKNLHFKKTSIESIIIPNEVRMQIFQLLLTMKMKQIWLMNDKMFLMAARCSQLLLQ